MSWVIRLFWTVDIAISFLTGYLDSAGVVVMRLGKIAVRYCKRQLGFDLIVVACDWAGAAWDVQGTAVARSWRLLRIAKLLRLQKIRKIFASFGNYIRSDKLAVVGSIGANLVTLALLLHFVACGWYALGKLSLESGSHSWVSETFMSPGVTLYLESLAFAAALFHGDVTINPESDMERLCLALALYVIFCWNVWLVSSITTGLTRLEIISTRRTAMFQSLNKYIAQNHVSAELARKVQLSALKALEEEEKNLPESSIELLQMISVTLRQELAFEIMQPILAMHPLFAVLTDFFPSAMQNVCLRSVTRLSLHAEDVLFNDADSASADPQGARMFFVESGILKYYKPGDAMFESIQITAGMWLSEATLWTDTWCHCATAKAMTDCQLVVVSSKDFRKQISTLSYTSQIAVYAKTFVEHLNMNGQRLMSDVGQRNVEMDIIMSRAFKEDWDSINRQKYFNGGGGEAGRTSFIGKISDVGRARRAIPIAVLPSEKRRSIMGDGEGGYKGTKTFATSSDSWSKQCGISPPR
eukprot:TRINITY_DN14549_c0_g1_i1.p1 TRINITY_DN14549_c0_g1~~TRINITY_DN14549_c0_g1_i1.p1  ORF type:complete len:527 (+),score=81.03 TRINITY_DN14549_c0_g1_i1:799-2379(+)